MKVKFLRDYRGRETGENLVKEGESWDIDPKEIKHLVNEEVIEKSALPAMPLFEDPQPEEAPVAVPMQSNNKSGKGRGKK